MRAPCKADADSRAQLTSAGGTAFQEQSVRAALPRASLLAPPVCLARARQIFFFVSIACMCKQVGQLRRLSVLPVCGCPLSALATTFQSAEASSAVANTPHATGKGAALGKTPRLPFERSGISLAFGESPSTVPSRLPPFLSSRKEMQIPRILTSPPPPPLRSCKYSACHAAEHRIFQCTSSRVTYMQKVLVNDV